MIFITGPHNSGKSTLAGWFKKHCFFHIETGDIIRKKYKEINPGIPFCDWAKKINKEQPNFFNEIILKEVSIDESYICDDEHKFQDLVITGNRQYSGIEYLIKNVNINIGTKNLIIYLDADPEELYRRQLQRMDRIILGLNYNKFQDYLVFDEQMGILEIKNRAEHIINCNCLPEEVIGKVSKILVEYGYFIKKD
jgi:dephospho-CoA kinase